MLKKKINIWIAEQIKCNKGKETMYLFQKRKTVRKPLHLGAKYLLFFLFFFWGRVSLLSLGCSAVVQSPLIATSASQVQAILLPQPPSSWDHRSVPPHLANFIFIFCKDRVSLCSSSQSWTPGLQQSSCLGLPNCWKYRHELPHPVCTSSLILLQPSWYYNGLCILSLL